MEAELCKLMTNAWRYIQFATVNQFYMIAREHGLDFDRILHGCRHNYPRMQGMPGPGFAAGPCLLKDTMQLAAFSRNTFLLGHAAMLVNEGLPARLVELARSAIRPFGQGVGVLGMAFKAESDDPRDSLSYKLRNLLALEARKVLCTDPYVPDPTLVPLERVLAEADVLFLATPHRAYRELRIPPGKVLSTCGTASRTRPVEDPRHRLGRVHRRLSRPGAARRGATRSWASTTSPSTGAVEKSYQQPSAVPVRRGRRHGRRPSRASSRGTATTSSPARRASAASRTSTSTPTTCWRRTSGSSRRASTRRSRLTARGGSRRSPFSRAAWSTRTRPRSRLPKGTTARARLRRAPTASRSSPASTSRAAPGSSTSSRTRSAGPSTAWASARRRALGGANVPSGNIRLAMSHVVPDLVQKVLKGQDPLHILGTGDQVRCYTYGGDLARGIAVAIEHPAAPERRLQPVDARRRRRSGSWPRPSGRRCMAPARGRGRSGSSAIPRIRTTWRSAFPTRPRRGGSWDSKRRPDSRTMLDEVVPWVRREIAEGRL